MVMNNNETLRHIIFKLLKEKYPKLMDVQVDSYSDNGKYYYTIFLGFKYNDVIWNDDIKIKQEVKNLFKNIYPHDNLQQVSYFDPN
jgi:hypothetical protein